MHLSTADVNTGKAYTWAAVHTFVNVPAGSGVGQGSLYINPASAAANYTLLGGAVGGDERFRIDEDGDAWFDGTIAAGILVPTSTAADYGAHGLTSRTLKIGYDATPGLITGYSSASDIAIRPLGTKSVKLGYSVLAQLGLEANLDVDGVLIRRDVDGASSYSEAGALLRFERDVTNVTSEDGNYIECDSSFLINKNGEVTMLGAIFTEAACFDAEYDNGNSGNADTVDWGNGNKQRSTLTDNCTFTFTVPDGPCNVVLKLIQDGTGSRLVTWPGTAKWPAATAPTLSTGAADIDIVAFYYDGTNYYGQSSLDFG